MKHEQPGKPPAVVSSADLEAERGELPEPEYAKRHKRKPKKRTTTRSRRKKKFGG
jgi:hypothetical protein